MNDTEQLIHDLEQTIKDLQEAEKKYELALMVYDVTVACLEAFMKPEWEGMLDSQIEAARDAYKVATGEEAMILTRRGKGEIDDGDV